MSQLHPMILNNWLNITREMPRQGEFILKGVKDHIIPHLTGKKTIKIIWIIIISLYQGSSEAKKLVLKDILSTIRMPKSYSVVSYPTKFTQVKDELVGCGRDGYR